MGKIKFYGWVNVAILTVLLCIVFGMAMHAGTLYIVPVCNDWQISRTEYGSVISISTVVGFFAALFIGRVLRFLKDVKKLIFLGLLSCVLFLLIFGLAPNIYVMYAAGIFRGFISPYMGMGLVSILISKWFYEKKAVALGIIAAGSGIGGTVLSPLVSYFINSFGWRRASIISACIVAAVSLPCFLLLREEPQRYGQEPLGSPESGNGGNIPRFQVGLPVDLAHRTPFFWLGMLGVSSGAVAVSTFYVNSAAILESKALAAALIPTVISVLYLFNTIAKIGVGPLLEKFGVAKTLVLSYILIIISCGMLIMAHNPIFAYIYAILFGLGFSFFSSPFTALVEQLVGMKDYGAIIGYFMASMQVGQAIAPIVTGALYDFTGGYDSSIVTAVAFLLVSLWLLLISLKHSKKYMDRQRENVKPA